jgi:histidyl-tRNA synthetase
MKKIEPKTLKGFRDFLPLEARKRQYVINTLKSVFELYGFEPLETPVLEYEEILTGKYGDEGDKLMYRFEDNGKRRVAMRYDQTVPLARVVAQYQNDIAFPFKRYQVQNVWRAENTQKGRYREFIQCDLDTVGVDSPLADAELITAAAKAYQNLGFKTFKILINDRAIFEGLSTTTIIAIDKLKKIGEEGVCKELVTKQCVETMDDAKTLLQKLLTSKPTERLSQIFKALEQVGIDESVVVFSPTLARGLDYYTGMIFEIESEEYPYGSLCGGGRYNELIGMFAGKEVPAVGLAVGFDRTMEAMEALNLFPDAITTATTQVLVTIFSKELTENALEITSQLRTNNINTEIYLGEIKEKNPLEKQLKYADAKNIPFVIIAGPEEVEKNIVTLRNMKTREQQAGTLDEIVQICNSSNK